MAINWLVWNNLLVDNPSKSGHIAAKNFDKSRKEDDLREIGKYYASMKKMAKAT